MGFGCQPDESARTHAEQAIGHLNRRPALQFGGLPGEFEGLQLQRGRVASGGRSLETLNVERPNLFPGALAKWLSQRDVSTVRRSLRLCIARACPVTEPPISIAEVTEAQVEQLDDRYLNLDEQGDTDGWQRAFRAARLAAAALGLKEDDLENSIYEFWSARTQPLSSMNWREHDRLVLPKVYACCPQAQRGPTSLRGTRESPWTVMPRAFGCFGTG